MSVDVSSTIVVGPRNITSFSQSTVNFTCTSDGPTDIYWKYAAYAGDSGFNIFDRGGRNKERFDERFVKTVKGSTCILTIRDVQTSDSGMYICRERTSSTQWSARLTVVG